MTSDPNPGESRLKYARGVSARVPSARPLTWLERITLAHVAVLLIGTTWAFGGMAEWVRDPIAWWASLGVLITLTAVQDHQAWREGWMRPLRWASPLLAFNLLVVLATLNPSFREVTIDGHNGLAHTGGHVGWPSSARPEKALHALWLFDALWLACFNLVLVVRQRRALRLLLLLAAGNAALLAVFGTVQKLTGAKGIYFDTFATPQPYFFASFVYHNHWGAFTLLMLGTGLALTWHFGRRRAARDFFHTPAFGGIVGLLVLAATIPLSGSRSSTALGTLLLGGAFIHWLVRLVRIRRRYRESVALPVGGAIAAVALGLAGVWYVARDTIAARLTLTERQVAEARRTGSAGDRVQLYGNTWRMAKDKLWFGWGMASYPQVFSFLYNTRRPVDKLPIFYHDAHSDWLQALAEHGLVGTTCLVLTAVLPLLSLRRRHFASHVPGYLFAGCAVLLLYAIVEFPFGNVAVVLCWWLCFFGAVHYARLQDRDASSPPAPARAAQA